MQFSDEHDELGRASDTNEGAGADAGIRHEGSADRAVGEDIY